MKINTDKILTDKVYLSKYRNRKTQYKITENQYQEKPWYPTSTSNIFTNIYNQA